MHQLTKKAFLMSAKAMTMFQKEAELLKQQMDEKMAKRESTVCAWTCDDFVLGNLIGKGKFGAVYCAKEKHTNFHVALKVLNKLYIIHENGENQIGNEIDIHMTLQHPNILRLYTFFHNDANIYIALEIASNGELYDYVQNQKYKRLPEDEVAKYAFQVADAVDYCHRNRIIHRSIKLTNLLLDGNMDLKLAKFRKSIRSLGEEMTPPSGKSDYNAPEIVQGRLYGFEVDFWSIGVLCYELLTGQLPSLGLGLYQNKVQDRTVSIGIKFPKWASPDAADAIRRMLEYDPQKRLAPAQLMQHPWIKRLYRQCQHVKGNLRI